MPNEICIICGKETDIDINTHIDYRYGYTEGAGQCCKECYDRTNGKRNDYLSNVMRHRRSLITMSGDEILNTPNDSELGAKVRQRYWETYEDKSPKMTCSLCGRDTSEVEYDYLSGDDHIACILAKELKG